MKNYPVGPLEMFNSIWGNRSLIKTLVKREVVGRYKGSIFGILWSFFNPLLMLLVYTFVFSVIFKARWSEGSNSRAEFALILFAGLIVFNLFSECLNRSPSLIIANVNYVKKVIFPLEILPLVSLGSGVFHALVSFGVWLIAYLIFYGIPSATILLTPLIVLPLIFMILGLTWFLSALGVYIRDTTQFVAIFTTILMFISPIFFPSSALPEKFQFFVTLNPIAPVIEGVRKIMFWGVMPDLTEYFCYLFATLITSFIGFAWFQKARKGFADVV